MILTRFRPILQKFADHDADFILVGGVAVLVHARIQPERRFEPNESHLGSPGHQLLNTKFGPLDLLGTIGEKRSYPDLLAHSTHIQISPGLMIRVLNLETLIATKEEAGREKDLAVLPTLRATLEEIRRRNAELSTTS